MTDEYEKVVQQQQLDGHVEGKTALENRTFRKRGSWTINVSIGGHVNDMCVNK